MRRELIQPAVAIAIGSVLTLAGMIGGFAAGILVSRAIVDLGVVPGALWLLSYVGILVAGNLGGVIGMLMGFGVHSWLKRHWRGTLREAR